ncbi:MAG: TetR/AcrR family transcriptional regulator [Solirubrobacteraceae bacterium]|nr:TetR/AcrR family transcriptional regulator [Solirubrobacteraceae bacterium]
MTEQTKRVQRPDGRKARTRKALLDAGSKLFSEQGVERTTVDEIAEAAGVSVGSLYVHFGSKDSLLLQLIDQALEINEQYMQAPEATSALARVLIAGEWYLRFAMEQTVAFRFVAMRVLEPDQSSANDEVNERIAERVQRIVLRVTSDLGQAMEDGEIEKVDLSHAMVFLWGAWNGVAGLVLRQDSLAVTQEVAEAALLQGREILIKGLGGDPAQYRDLPGLPPTPPSAR